MCRRDKRQSNNRLLGVLLFVSGAMVVVINFFMTEISQSWQWVTVLFSFFVSMFAVLLCVYAIGFTTIRMSLGAIAVFAVILSVWIENTPAKIRLKLARPNFEEVLAELSNGSQRDPPFWVGTFHVKSVKQLASGEIRFWTAEHPYGNTGLVYNPNGQPAVNAMFKTELDENWYFVCVD